MATIVKLIVIIIFIGCVGAATQTVQANNPPGATGVVICTDVDPEMITVTEPNGVSYIIYPEDFREVWPDGGSRPIEMVRP